MDELAGGSRLSGMAEINDFGDFLMIAAAPECDRNATCRDWSEVVVL